VSTFHARDTKYQLAFGRRAILRKVSRQLGRLGLSYIGPDRLDQSLYESKTR